MNIGSYGYKKGAATISGGNDKVKVLISVSKEEGDQYKDGDGYTLAEQLENYTASTPSLLDNPYNYSSSAKDMKAFEKTMFMDLLMLQTIKNYA